MRLTLLLLIIFCYVSIICAADFQRDDNVDIVTDSETGLTWQDNNEAKTKNLNWQEAINYCEALDLGGYSDWRLPNVRELKSIVNIDRRTPSSYPDFRSITPSAYLVINHN